MPANDPWSWTAEELIAALCYSNALFQAAGYAENAPDPEALETQLRSQQVTGHKFLTVLDRRRLVLDNDLKIAHLSQRIALLAVIELLRHRSFTYKQRATTAGVGSLNINSADLSPSDGPSGSFTVDDAGRKRRRVTDLSTVPLSNVPHKLPETPIASVAAASWQASGDADEFAHLLKWQNAADDDDVMDLVGEEDLDDDEYYSPGDAAEEDPRDLPEDDHERPGGASTRAKLSNDEIAEIVNDRIEFYVNSWQPNKGVARGEEIHYEPVRMWEEAEASGKRQELVHKYETDYEYYSQRLHRLFEEIVMWGGSSAVSGHPQTGHIIQALTSHPCRTYDANAGIWKSLYIRWSSQVGCGTFTNWNLSKTAKSPIMRMTAFRTMNRDPIQTMPSIDKDRLWRLSI
jgi:hypothetical protein